MLTYDAHPTIARFHKSDAFVRGLVGPLGSGKSFGCVAELYRRACEQEPNDDGVRKTRMVIIRNTYRELKDTTLATFEDFIPEEQRSWRESDMTCRLYFGLEDGTIVDCEVLFRALDKPSDISKLLSLELTMAWLNEAREIPRNVIDMIQGRVGRYPAKRDGGPTWHGVIMDTNPCDVTDWWYTIFEVQKPAEWSLFHQPGGVTRKAENLLNLPTKYYERLMQGHTPDWINIYVHGQYGFTIEGRAIYPEYIDEKHTLQEPYTVSPHGEIFVGLDFGLTPAATFMQKTVLGQWITFDEIVTADMGAVSFAEELAEKIRGKYRGHSFTIAGDPSGDQRSQVDERTPFDVLQAKRIPAFPAPTNDILIRREAVAKLLRTLTMAGEPALLISAEGAPMLRKGMMGGYNYKRMNISGSTDRFQEKPDKNIYSHICEALQYGVLGAGLGDTIVRDDQANATVKVNGTRSRNKRRNSRAYAEGGAFA